MKEKEGKRIGWLITTIVAIITVAILFVGYGIDWVTITCMLCLPIVEIIITIGLLALRYDCYEDGFGCAIAVMFSILVLVIVVMVCMFYYDSAVSLPYKYNAAVQTVDETNELLLKIEDNQTLAGGLEALELKKTLKDAIEKKNNLRGEIDAWFANAFTPYKDVLRENLRVIKNA